MGAVLKLGMVWWVLGVELLIGLMSGFGRLYDSVPDLG